MHGRLKVRTTAEQQAAKAKERAAKVEKLTKAKQFIFSTMTNIEACSTPVRLQLNRVTAEVLSHIPEFHTVWNVRKRILLKTKAEILAKLVPAATTLELTPTEEKQSTQSDGAFWNDLATVVANELTFIVECIRHQPKAYPIWYHRIWLYSRFLDSSESAKLASQLRAHLEEDLRLTELLLSQDERNFHCWEFRRFVLARLERPAKQELAFLHERIANNFSNYSAWHQRCMLLFEDGVPSDLRAFLAVFSDEFELLENAFYTDPADQSSWCYYRWLLAKALEHAAAPHSALRIAYVRQESDKAELVLVLDEPLSLDELRLLLDKPVFPSSSSFRPAFSTDETVSSVWFVPVSSHFSLAEAFGTFVVLPDVALFPHTDDAADVSEENRAALRCVLSRHAESFVALAQLESENPTATSKPETAAASTRNCLLTHTALLEQLDAHVHAETVRRNYAELARLDPARHRVYETMHARFEVRLRRDDSSALHARTMDLSNVGLTLLPDCRAFAFVTSLCLRANSLTGPFDRRNCSALRALTHLDLSANRVTDLTGLHALCSLRVLNLEDNLIADSVQLAPLASLLLTELNLARNPISQRYARTDELDEPACSILKNVTLVRWQ